MGIVGIADKDEIDSILWNQMVKSMIHENWFKTDRYINKNFAVGRVHIGIINSEPQPIFNEDGTLCVFMDGEIFDYEKERKELTSKGHKFGLNNDAEFCLHLHEGYGKEFVRRLNGSFVLAILDIKNQKLLVANDRYGLRPLYYYNGNGRFVFASEVKAIIQDKTFKKRINNEAVDEFFTFGHLLGDKTFFKEINVLPPASVLVYQNGRIEIEQYWDFKFEEPAHKHPIGYYVDNLVQLFKQAVERRMIGDHRFGVSLSGGLDSRAVVAAIDRKHYPISTITFSFPGMDDSPKIAKQIAEKLGTVHKQFQIEMDFLAYYAEKCVYLTDGMLNLRHFHFISLLDKFRKCADVILDGWEGETTFRGWFLDEQLLSANNDDELARILYEKYKIVHAPEKQHLFSQKYYNKIQGLAFKSVKNELKKSKNNSTGYKANYFVFQNRMRRFLTNAFVYRRTKYEDRKPFRDNDLIDFSLKIPYELTYNEKLYIRFLKKLLPKSLRIKDNNARIRIDFPARSLLYKIMRKIRKISRRIVKSDYPPYGKWIRKNENLQNYVKNILLDERTLNREYFNRNYIIKMLEEHMNYRKNHTDLIFVLLTFELWHRLFMDDR